MSAKERHRLELMAQVRDEEITLVEASDLLALSYRQTKRLWRRYRLERDKGLLHRQLLLPPLLVI